ncbi:MAG: hypothetical protein AAGF02_04655 [Actinomycetota bacterium]
MHVFVPPAPRPRVRDVDDAIHLVDGLAWLADDDEVVVVVLDVDRQLLAVIACGSATGRVLGGDARPVILPAIALGASAVAVVALGSPDERSVQRARLAIEESAHRAELRLDGVVIHERTVGRPAAAPQTSRSRASP